MDKISQKIQAGIDRVEGQLAGKDLTFVSVDANDVPEIVPGSVPSLVYFKNGEPTVYEGIAESVLLTSSLSDGRAGHLRYFLIFSIIKMLFFAFYIK